jgi:hypothetical protein
MRKMALIVIAAVVMLFAGALDWRAEATTLNGASHLPAVTKNFSPVERVACGGPGPNCPWGRTWVCRPRGCWCAPCGGYYRPWRWRY